MVIDLRESAAAPSPAIGGRISLGHPASRLRRCTAADEAFCRALFHQCRAAEFAALRMSDVALEAMLDQQLHAQRSVYARRFPDAEHFVVSHAGSDVGRILLTLQDEPAAVHPSDGAAQQLPAQRALHLIDITIATAAQRRGIGRDVVESLARAGQALGATQFTLSVLQTNHAARRFYESLGFNAAGDGVYLPMTRDLSRAPPLLPQFERASC